MQLTCGCLQVLAIKAQRSSMRFELVVSPCNRLEVLPWPLGTRWPCPPDAPKSTFVVARSTYGMFEFEKE